jgi:N-methylhydantoinase B
VEIIESEFPTRVRRFELVPDSGGPGAFRGGLGVVREYENLGEARFSIRSNKHVIPPKGVAGGSPGRCGRLTMQPGKKAETILPSRYSDYPLTDGDVFRLETPGGGGYGDPRTRDPERVLRDVVEGYVTLTAARTVYGVALKRANGGYGVDAAETAKLRAKKPAKKRAKVRKRARARA